jgi:hypothetical protein
MASSSPMTSKAPINPQAVEDIKEADRFDVVSGPDLLQVLSETFT